MAPTASFADTGMELRDLLSDPDFPLRTRKVRPSDREVEALRRLASVFSCGPEVVLQELCDIVVELCGADSAGVSLEVPTLQRFRWIAISGTFARFLQGTTPRFASPCGVCLDRQTPQHYRVSQPFYDVLGIEAEPILDGILVPWTAENARGTLWMVSHTDAEAFDLEDYRVLRNLADFAAVAVRQRKQQDALVHRAELAGAAAMANDLAHQINNPLQCLTNTIYLASKGGNEMPRYLQQASVELENLSSRVRHLLNYHPPT